MHIGLPYEDHDIKTLNIKTIMENIKDYQQYLRGYNYTEVLKVDVDKNQALAAAARIQSIPTLFFITKNGDIERVVGGLPYQELVRMAEKIS